MGDDERLRHAADVLARYRFELWKCGDSIGYEGLLPASDLLGDNRWQGFVHGAIKAWAGRAQRAFYEMDNGAVHLEELVGEISGEHRRIKPRRNGRAQLGLEGRRAGAGHRA